MILRGFMLLVRYAWASSAFAQLTAVDVRQIITQAATRATEISPNSVIAVTDREGNVLGVWIVRGGERPARRDRNLRFKGWHCRLPEQRPKRIHVAHGWIYYSATFSARVINTPTGPLVGVGLSNLFILRHQHDSKRPGSVIVLSPIRRIPGHPRIMPVPGASLDGIARRCSALQKRQVWSAESASRAMARR